MKRLTLSLVLVGLMLAACGTDSSSSASLDLGLIPQEAAIVGTIDVPAILKIDLVKDNLPKDIRAVEKELGISLADLGSAIFWTTADVRSTPDVGVVTKGLKISAFEGKGQNTLDFQGVKIIQMDDKNAVCDVNGQVVFGTLAGVKATINAAQNKITNSNGSTFNELLGKTSGMLNLAFIPDAKTKEEFISNLDSVDGLSDLAENLTGLAFGLNYASKKIELRLAVASDENAAKQASKMLSEFKSDAKEQIEGIGMMLGKEIASELKKALDSFKTKVDSEYLKVNLDISEALITGAVSQLGGMFGGSLMDQFED